MAGPAHRRKLAAAAVAVGSLLLAGAGGAMSTAAPTAFAWSVRGTATADQRVFAVVGNGHFVLDSSGQVADVTSAVGTLAVGVTNTREPSLSDLWEVSVQGPGSFTQGRAVSLDAELVTRASARQPDPCAHDPFGSIVLDKASRARPALLVLEICGTQVTIRRAVLSITPLGVAPTGDPPA